MVDIPMCVYNHEHIISQAIIGVLSQKTTFKIRLIIGEDCSTDNTRAIIEEWVIKNPEIIYPIYHKTNLGAKQNSITLLNRCTAKYIALCDGDDYWSDPFKLQKQIDFLEMHKEYVAHCHNALILNNDAFIGNYNSYTQGQELSIIDILTSLSIPTSSVVFKNVLSPQMPKYLLDFMWDLTIYYTVAQHGKFYVSPEIMSVYRCHGGGMWTGQDEFTKINEAIKVNERLIEFLPLRKQEKQAVRTSIVGLRHNRIKNHANRYQFGWEYFSDIASVIYAKIVGYNVALKYLAYCVIPNSIVGRVRHSK